MIATLVAHAVSIDGLKPSFYGLCYSGGKLLPKISLVGSALDGLRPGFLWVFLSLVLLSGIQLTRPIFLTHELVLNLNMSVDANWRYGLFCHNGLAVRGHFVGA